MAIYAIGDLQGCFDALQQLLDKINFDPLHDQLWFSGDLVNRGPDSLKILRFITKLGDSAVTVLGNHDLHLLAVSKRIQKAKKSDSLDELLNAEDRDDLLNWLRHCPLMHVDDEFCLIHAGLPPQWDLEQASQCAREVENILRGDHVDALLQMMYGDYPDQWSESLSGWERARFIINCFTRMRYCDDQGKLDLEHKGPPGTQPPHLRPWFENPNRKNRSTQIIFGHWSTLGFYQGHNCFCVDSGCLWGGQLTALRLCSAPSKISIDCPCFKRLSGSDYPS